MKSERKNIMVFIAPGILETWGGLKELCEAKGVDFVYNTLKAKKYPICVGGHGHIYKVPFKKHCIDLENQRWGEKK